MKFNKKYILLTVITLLSMVLFSSKVEAYIVPEIRNSEYSKEYEEWTKLSDEEKANTIMPRMFDVKEERNNKAYKLLKSNDLTYFNLKDSIENNLKVRNQMQTGSCWTFSSLAALESTLALQDLRNNDTEIEYDFSERHMEYATSRTFLNDEINYMGFDRSIGDGGNTRISITYLTNGMGAIDENEMEFENNENLISIDKIKNKKVVTQVYDTIEIANIGSTEYIKNQIKSHLQNYGGVIASIHGAERYSEYFNQDTGAMYCDDKEKCGINHEVLIVGWNDGYDISNFSNKHVPSTPGAWIIKNSWGTNIGDNGFMYVSYEDVNIYSDLVGIVKASNKVNYDHIYQYNEYGYNGKQYFTGVNKLFLASEFEKKSTNKEYITEVSLQCPETYICKVYVNVNGTSRNSEDLVPVMLKAGESETVNAGYHTLEFAEPIEIMSDEFVVVIEINGNDSEVNYCIEMPIPNTIYSFVTNSTDKCFVTTEHNLQFGYWTEMKTMDLTIKAFTVEEKDARKPGDINGDGKVNMKDWNRMYEHINETNLLTGDEFLCADINGDGKVNMKDWNRVYEHINETNPLY